MEKESLMQELTHHSEHGTAVHAVIGDRMGGVEMISIYEGIILAGALVGVYVKLQSELGKLKSRVHILEQSKSEVTDMLRKLAEDIGEIKLLLARKQIDK